MNKVDPTKHYQSYLYMGYVWAVIVLIMLFLTSCYVYESSYSTTQHNCELMERGQQCLSDHRCCETQEHSTEVYYYNDLPYWGFYSGYYYYYGVPHYYPWWYYYSVRPHYGYNVHTHVHIHCDNGHYVSTPRGPKFNNGKNRTYKPNKTIIVKPNRGNNRTIIKTNTKTKVNINPNTNTKVNTNKNRSNTNIKINKSNNKSNIRTNNRSNIKINNTKSNNRTNNRSTKSNTRKPR